jgi:hypothetical protein
MAFLLENPYAHLSGQKSLAESSGDIWDQGDPYTSTQHFLEYAPSWDWNSMGTLQAKAEFQPYVSVQNWSSGPDSYGVNWIVDYDALKADTDKTVAADRARYNTMEGWADSSLGTVGPAPNVAG